ncbi:hypothetical protein [Salininema proteolyticum]|uniref:Uncharacterized protein n=1 Tax=Salininema proteolyticum TaxID=1607685 RepID=A0ABV8TWR7_9ACTN
MHELDLRTHGRELVERQWLLPGERIIVAAPSWRLPRLHGISKPRTDFSDHVRETSANVRRFVRIVVEEAFFAKSTGNAMRIFIKPDVVITGHDDAEAAEAVINYLRLSGLWVLTDRRLAYLVPDGQVKSRRRSGLPDNADLPAPEDVALSTAAEFDADRYRYAGLQSAGQYHLVEFPDGSTIELVDAEG